MIDEIFRGVTKLKQNFYQTQYKRLLPDSKFMKKTFLITLVLTVLISFMSCTKKDTFFVGKGKVGTLVKSTQVKDLKKIFVNDSLVVNLTDKPLEEGKNKYFTDDDTYLVYEKGGKHLLTIIPVKPHDSLSTLKSIEIFDNRYRTLKGISLFSPYKDINTAYVVNITNTLSSAHLDIDELNATMLIDKKEIGINTFNRKKIRPDNIPDLAKIKHFTIWFN